MLRRVLVDEAFAAAALDAEIDRHPQLDARGRGQLTDLVYGSLRVARYLDGRLVRLAPRGLGQLDPLAHAHLWVAGYQLLFLPDSSPQAAINGAVEAIKQARGQALAGFINAILRKLSAEAQADPAPLSPLAAHVAGAPRWLLRALDRALGEGEGALFLGAGPVPPPLCLRVREGDRATWAAELRAFFAARGSARAEVTEGDASPWCLRVRGAGDARRWPGITDGRLVIQEEGSQVVASLVGAQPGEIVLDACAGRGNKTLVLLDQVGPSGRVDAADLHGPKLDHLRAEAGRLGLSLGQTAEVDLSVGVAELSENVYDAVLVDAPCSGTGTLRRRPEILLRRVESDLASLQSLQRAIVRNAARLVKPGGRLVFAVCSVLREECEQVIEGLEGFTLREVRRLAPHRTGTDGYAAAVLVRG